MSRAIEISSPDGTIDAHIFTPDNASEPLPAVVLLTDIGGLRPCYFDKAQTIADDGYAVLMPNIYYRDGAGSPVPEGKSFRDDDVLPGLFELSKKLTPDAQKRDSTAYLATIDTEAEFADGPVGAVGYCLTGSFALRMAADHPERVAAAAGFHSAGLAVEDDTSSVMHVADKVKAQVYFGHADKDDHLPPEQIARLDAAMANAGVHFTTELYAGSPHGYTAADVPAYDEAADARHYKRLSTLFEETLA
ncbi:dienelactone hydrolase family protein [Salinisphaera aquimarina]|uniref:Dienelactone hydrolase family protein n=1 Tax=Salinisphaera aquimarina TaxID=2094031 RepID=A0ABV7EMQ5_9GAMM